MEARLEVILERYVELKRLARIADIDRTLHDDRCALEALLLEVFENAFCQLLEGRLDALIDVSIIRVRQNRDGGVTPNVTLDSTLRRKSSRVEGHHDPRDQKGPRQVTNM